MARWLGPFLLVLLGCVSSGLEPLAILRDVPPGGSSETVVLLRGIGADHGAFFRHGWVDEVRRRALDWTVVAPDADLGYYRARTLVPRLAEDVVQPVRRDGHERVWLVGLSMGGMGGLYYLDQRPAEVAGVVLVSPYLGSPEVVEAIRAAGGIRVWQAPEITGPEDWEWDLWRTIQRLLAAPPAPIFLAFGAEDKHAAGQRLLAEALPADRVLTVDGGHRHPVFEALWREILDRGVIGGEGSGVRE